MYQYLLSQLQSQFYLSQLDPADIRMTRFTSFCATTYETDILAGAMPCKRSIKSTV